MNPRFRILFNFAVLACLGLGQAAAQENLLPVSRTTGLVRVQLPADKTTLMALPLANIVASGTILNGGGTTTLNVTVGTPLGDLVTAPHAIKITSRDDQRGTGLNAPAGTSTNAYGRSAKITANTASQVTTDSALSPNNGDEFIIYSLATLESLFGDPPVAGWNSSTGSGSADIVYLDNGAGVLVGYFHKDAGPGGTGWRLASAPTGASQNGAAIPQGRAAMVKRRTGANVALDLSGVTMVGRETATVSAGFSVINNPFTAGTTLAASLISGSITGSSASTSADILYLENAGVLTGYFFKNSGAGGTGWRLITAPAGADQGAVVLSPGKAILFKEQAGAVGFTLPEPFAE